MITFGNFGHVVDKENEKKNFLEQLNILLSRLTDGEEKKYKEMEIIKPLKELLKKEENSYFNRFYKLFFSSFLENMGLTYCNLTQKEKEEILVMDFTYENVEKKH